MPAFAKRIKNMERSAAVIAGLFQSANDPEIISFGIGAPAKEALPVEIVREIANSCSRNQMRDVFFEEAELDDPEAWVRARIQGDDLRTETQTLPGGAVCVYAEHAGLFQKFLFTPIDD